MVVQGSQNTSKAVQKDSAAWELRARAAGMRDCKEGKALRPVRGLAKSVQWRLILDFSSATLCFHQPSPLSTPIHAQRHSFHLLRCASHHLLYSTRQILSIKGVFRMIKPCAADNATCWERLSYVSSSTLPPRFRVIDTRIFPSTSFRVCRSICSQHHDNTSSTFDFALSSLSA